MGFNFTLFHHYQTLLTHPQSSSDRGPFVFVQCWGTKVKSVTVDISFRPVCSDPKAITTHHLFPYLFSCPSGSHGHSTAVQLLFLIWIFMELFFVSVIYDRQLCWWLEDCYDVAANDANRWERAIYDILYGMSRFPWLQATHTVTLNVETPTFSEELKCQFIGKL